MPAIKISAFVYEQLKKTSPLMTASEPQLDGSYHIEVDEEVFDKLNGIHEDADMALRICMNLPTSS